MASQVERDISPTRAFFTKEIVRLKELVDDIDPNAFVIVSDAREVHGEGFIEKN